MGSRDRMRKHSQKFLEPGETIEQIFPVGVGSRIGKSSGQYSAFRIVAVTDRNIVVLDRNLISRPTRIRSRLPRDTEIGPVSGLMECKISTLGEEHGVLQRFYKDVEAADTAAGFPTE